MDFSGLSLIKLKKEEMETQVGIVRMWNFLIEVLGFNFIFGQAHPYKDSLAKAAMLSFSRLLSSPSRDDENF